MWYYKARSSSACRGPTDVLLSVIRVDLEDVGKVGDYDQGKGNPGNLFRNNILKNTICISFTFSSIVTRKSVICTSVIIPLIFVKKIIKKTKIKFLKLILVSSWILIE